MGYATIDIDAHAVVAPIAAKPGLLTGLGGVPTLLPALGDAAGAVFGLGAMAWFSAIGLRLFSPLEPEAMPARPNAGWW